MLNKNPSILFVHQNFPGQFLHLAPALLAKGYDIKVMAMLKEGLSPKSDWQGMSVSRYALSQGSTPKIHPWAIDIETKVIRAEGAFRLAIQMKEEGFLPDLIIAHPGWGESLFLKEVWPQAQLAIYCEYFYHMEGGDVNFDPEFPSTDPGDACRLRLKNLNHEMHFGMADAAISPTYWQADTFPKDFRQKITVIHDGINTERVKPNKETSISLTNLKGKFALSSADEVITFVNRNLEPERGYHIFMRALPQILKERPNARVLIVGGNDVSYGARPPNNQTWRDLFFNEVKDQIDPERIHFVGNIPYENFLNVLQVSSVHVYLTYPFVLSWSMLEAMSAECAIVASNTPPVKEVIQNNHNGVLVDFFDSKKLAESVVGLLKNPKKRQKLGQAARKYAIEHYDLQKVCLPKQIEWVSTLLKSKKSR